MLLCPGACKEWLPIAAILGHLPTECIAMTFKTVWLALMSLFFYVSGWLCIFKTNMLANRGRVTYGKSKLIHSLPSSKIVRSPRYPAYIRCAGVFIWLWALAFDYLVLSGKLH